MLFYYLASTQLGTFYFKEGGTLWYKNEKANVFAFTKVRTISAFY